MKVNNEALVRLENKIDYFTRLFSHHLIDEKGGVELAVKVLPTITNHHYVYRLARSGKIPCQKLGGRYLFSRLELSAWIEDGSPQPANEWADNFRRRIAIPEQVTDAA